jgi:hypothetical protein
MVMTIRLQIERLDWVGWNKEHATKHGVSFDDITAAIRDTIFIRPGYKDRFLIFGRKFVRQGPRGWRGRGARKAERLPGIQRSTCEPERTSGLASGAGNVTMHKKPQPSEDFGYPTPADGPVPAVDSIEEEAEFWDTHDLTDLIKEGAEEIELVLGPDFGSPLPVRLAPNDRKELDRRAGDMGVEPSTLARMWIEERLKKVAS